MWKIRLEKWLISHNSSYIFFPPVEVVDYIEFTVIPKYLNRDFLHQKYVVEKLSCEEISRQIFSSKSTVLKYLKLHKIPLRGVGTGHKIKYGIKKIGEKISTHKSEVEIIKKMELMKKRGDSYWTIAKHFNNRELKTKRKGGKWHPNTIKSILDRRIVKL